MEIRCIITGRGPKGAVIVCDTPKGDIVLKAKKVGGQRYDVYSEVPYMKYKTTIYANRPGVLRRNVQEWLSWVLSQEK